MIILKTISLLLRTTFLLVVLALLILFALDNRGAVEIVLAPSEHIVFVPIYVVALVMFALGVVVGVMSCLVHYNRKLWRLYGQVRKLHRENDALRQEAGSLSVEQHARRQMKQHIMQLEHDKDS